MERRNFILGALGMATLNACSSNANELKPLDARELPVPSTGKIHDIRDYGAVSGEVANQAIVDALNNAVAGDLVYVPEGEWLIELGGGTLWESIYLQSDISILGGGASAVLKLVGPVQNRVSALMADGKENITLENFTIDCSYLGHRTDSTDSRVNGVTLKDCSGCTVRNMMVLDGYGYGIWIWGGEYNSVERCYVRNFEDNIELTKSNNNIVKQNVIESYPKEERDFEYSGASVNSGILLYQGSSNNLVEFNSCIGKEMGVGISTYSAYKDENGKDPSANIFRNNYLDIEGYGFIVAGTDTDIESCFIQSTGYPAMVLWDNSENHDIRISSNNLISKFPEVGSGPYWNPYCLYEKGRSTSVLIQKNVIVSPDQSGVYLLDTVLGEGNSVFSFY